MSDEVSPGQAIAILGCACVLSVLLTHCGSAAQGAAAVQTTPQASYVLIDASDGGSITIGGDVWQDSRTAGASADADQQGQDIDAQVEASASVPVSTGGRP